MSQTWFVTVTNEELGELSTAIYFMNLPLYLVCFKSSDCPKWYHYSRDTARAFHDGQMPVKGLLADYGRTTLNIIQF